ncbi:MAG: peptidoglycan editing factor PgeF [Candidatus Omnitrophica bacterium]|nr:peptidoglycan editing factor PgeF [Candidatus Omnitrophota bacterium]MDD5653166.1 peptidoglycan editing factor PgeF [Candidatus Omnitrophota bacterium]
MIFQHPGLICAFSKQPQNMSLDYGDTGDSLSNRKLFLNSLGIDYRALVCAKQVHATAVRYVTKADRGKGALSASQAIADTDSLVTNEKNLPLAIFTADCLSVFIYDPKHSAIANTHAGWRSTHGKICVKTLGLMSEKFRTEPADVYIGFGPSIGKCCYRVGKEFSNYFPQSVRKENQNYFFDLAGENLRQLLETGVVLEKVSLSNICTSCKISEYFSFRKQGNACGRMMSVIMLK